MIRRYPTWPGCGQRKSRTSLLPFITEETNISEIVYIIKISWTGKGSMSDGQQHFFGHFSIPTISLILSWRSDRTCWLCSCRRILAMSSPFNHREFVVMCKLMPRSRACAVIMPIISSKWGWPWFEVPTPGDDGMGLIQFFPHLWIDPNKSRHILNFSCLTEMLAPKLWPRCVNKLLFFESSSPFFFFLFYGWPTLGRKGL